MKEEEAEGIRYPKLKSKPAFLRDAGAAAINPFVTVRDAKSHLSELLEWVSGGREITITSAGRPKARLVAASPEAPRKLFRGMGKFLSSQPVHRGPTFDELIREDRDARG
jgi:prevent-host-death family protein